MGDESPTEVNSATSAYPHLPFVSGEPGEIIGSRSCSPASGGLGKTTDLENQTMGVGKGMAMGTRDFDPIHHGCNRMPTGCTNQRGFGRDLVPPGVVGWFRGGGWWVARVRNVETVAYSSSYNSGAKADFAMSYLITMGLGGTRMSTSRASRSVHPPARTLMVARKNCACSVPFTKSLKAVT